MRKATGMMMQETPPPKNRNASVNEKKIEGRKWRKALWNWVNYWLRLILMMRTISEGNAPGEGAKMQVRIPIRPE